MCIFAFKVFSQIINKSVEKRMKFTKTFAIEIKGVPYIDHYNYATEE